MYKIDEIKMLRLGQRDENLAREIPMDASEWLELYPGASITILFRRPGESTITPMITTLIGTTLTWQINDFEVGITGVGNAEIRAVDTAGLRRKSRIIPCSIEDTLLGDDETVLYTQDQVDTTLAHIGEAAESALAAKASEEAAALSAENASGSADAAQAAQDAAESARDAAQAAQTAAEEADAGAETAQSGAIASAQAAENARIAAQTAQASAQGSASQAAADKAAAQTAQQAAETAQHAAETAAGNAQASAGAASGSASAAAQSASDAAASAASIGEAEQRAATSAQAAAQSASQAATKATQASQSASQASASADQAASSATSAASSATAAAGSADAAQAVLDSIPEDYTALSEDVTSLKSAFQYANYETIDQSENFTSGEYIALNVGVGNTVSTTPVSSVQRGYVILPCKKGDSFLLTATGASAPRAWGFTDGQYKLLSVSGIGSNASGTTLIAEADGYFISNHDVKKTYSLVATQLQIAMNERTGGILAQEKVDDNNEDVLGYEHINLFNRATIADGKYLNPETGNIGSNTDWFASDWIDVTGISPLKIYGTKYVCCYNAAKEFIASTPEADTYDEAKTQTLPTGTKYIRVSAGNVHLNETQVGKAVYTDRRIDYPQYELKNLLIAEDQIIESPIIVDANGNGDYTSFTLACKENYGNNRDIIIMPGTYDINAEYIAIWGAEAVGSMADDDSETFGGWQYGVKMNGRKFTFQPGAKLVCDRTGYTVDGTHRFSALRVEMNVEIIGLDLDCTHLFYGIHDDYGNNQSIYTNTYRNCRVIGHNLTNVNCIGGGCKKYSRHILENCYFDNNTSSSTAVRYHNTNYAGAVPEIYVSNCYFGTSFRANYYGTQETKMRVYVNNCHAKSIYKGEESSSYTVDNVELYKWNNEETESA